MQKKSMHLDYNDRVLTLPEDDFFGQTKRTIAGQRISDEQFQIILDDIDKVLEFKSDDVLLDLCCGNGHLSSHFFDKIAKYTGVDSSENLLNIAEKYFNNGKTNYYRADIIDFLSTHSNPSVYTKVLFSSSMQYFSPSMIKNILATIKERFINVDKILITPIPDRDRAENFFGAERLLEHNLDDHTSELGRFYSFNEFAKLVNKAEYLLQYITLNENAHNAHYRYAVLLNAIR